MKFFVKKRGKDSFLSLWFRNLFPVLLGIGIGIFFLLEGINAALAQDTSSSSALLQGAPEGEVKGKESPAKIWQAYREFAQKGSWDKSRNELELIHSTTATPWERRR